MAILSLNIHNLRYFGLRDLIWVHSADADSLVVHVKHNTRRLLAPLGKVLFEHVNDEFHWRVGGVQPPAPVEARLPGPRARLGGDARSALLPATGPWRVGFRRQPSR